MLDKVLEKSSDHLFNDAELDELVKELREIYQGGFRHQYNRIFNILSMLDKNDSSRIGTVAENIRTIYQKIQDDESLNGISSQVEKLYDHVNLEVSRIQYTHNISQNWISQGKDLYDKISNINKRADDMQREYITILGIFSSIVIAFVSGLVFSSSVLNNIDKVSIYRLTFVVLGIAMVLFNLVNLLLEFLKSINKFSVNTPEPNRGAPMIAIINMVIVMLMLVDIALWAFFWYRATGYQSF